MTAGAEVLLCKNIYMYIYSYSPWAFSKTTCIVKMKAKRRKGRIASYM